MKKNSDLKTAIVYDRVNKWGGAERVLLALHEIFPEAPIFTAVYHPEKALWAKIFPKVIPSFLNKFTIMRDKHELLGTFTPIAFETFDFTDFDLVISVTSEAAKGIVTKPSTLHICYMLTPTRYLWSHYDFYFRNPLLKLIAQPVLWYLRKWDKIAAQRPDVIVAISHAVKVRIKKYYKRDSVIIFPSVDVEKFRPQKKAEKIVSKKLNVKNYYLFVSRLIPYKRPDLAVEAFNDLGLPFIVVGTGSEEKRLRLIANKNIVFTGQVTEDELVNLYKNAKALVFPGEEDFGIVMVEAQAAGIPVIAFNKGGAKDIVINKKTGLLFDRQTKPELIKTIQLFEKSDFIKNDLIDNAKKFSKNNFKAEIKKLIERNLLAN